MSERICPHCGQDIKPDAISCTHCGSDWHTGWKNTSYSEHPDVAPFDDNDYEDLHQKEFGHSSHGKKAFPWKPIAVGFVIIVLVIARLL